MRSVIMTGLPNTEYCCLTYILSLSLASPFESLYSRLITITIF